MAELFYTIELAKRSATCLLFIQCRPRRSSLKNHNQLCIPYSPPRPAVRVQSTLVYRPAELLCSNA
ncbi:Uncharacterized protein APZ42_023849 [Daphnia magna]|uniref:Uncharacterized protein n=1 Tax=Daphnia magna TaxID=35525 RepID=A0A0P6F3B7_9CRUS|nr:Uncharacterized protein APZ42_023849 [Daphnia magna]